MAAEHLAIGVTALGKANYARHAQYGHAFFALSTGLERAAKLALVVDFAVDNNGAFPPNMAIKEFGHNLRELLARTNLIVERRGLSDELTRLPDSPIHKAIIEILSDFASNITRYYNLDVVTDAPTVAGKVDPVAQWFSRVVQPVFANHCPLKKREEHRTMAELVDRDLGPYSMVLHTAENGQEITTVYGASMQVWYAQSAAPYVRMYVLHVVRFVAQLLSHLGYLGQTKPLQDIPYLGEFFAIFLGDDRYFKRRKVWSIYRH